MLLGVSIRPTQLACSCARTHARTHALIPQHATPSALLQPSELTAGKGSKPTVVAGAISNRAREGGCPNITGEALVAAAAAAAA